MKSLLILSLVLVSPISAYADDINSIVSPFTARRYEKTQEVVVENLKARLNRKLEMTELREHQAKMVELYDLRRENLYKGLSTQAQDDEIARLEKVLQASLDTTNHMPEKRAVEDAIKDLQEITGRKATLYKRYGLGAAAVVGTGLGVAYLTAPSPAVIESRAFEAKHAPLFLRSLSSEEKEFERIHQNNSAE